MSGGVDSSVAAKLLAEQVSHGLNPRFNVVQMSFK